MVIEVASDAPDPLDIPPCEFAQKIGARENLMFFQYTRKLGPQHIISYGNKKGKDLSEN